MHLVSAPDSAHGLQAAHPHRLRLSIRLLSQPGSLRHSTEACKPVMAGCTNPPAALALNAASEPGGLHLAHRPRAHQALVTVSSCLPVVAARRAAQPRALLQPRLSAADWPPKVMKAPAHTRVVRQHLPAHALSGEPKRLIDALTSGTGCPLDARKTAGCMDPAGAPATTPGAADAHEGLDTGLTLGNSSGNSSGLSLCQAEASCFPGSAMLTTPSGPLRMDGLRIGTQVACMPPWNFRHCPRVRAGSAWLSHTASWCMQCKQAGAAGTAHHHQCR